MSRKPPTVTLLLLVIVLAVAAAGCSTSAPTPPSPAAPGNGTLHVSSVPAGADVYFDGQYRSTTHVAMYPVPTRWSSI